MPPATAVSCSPKSLGRNQDQHAPSSAPSPLLRSLVAHLEDPVVVLDGSGGLILQTPPAVALLGRPRCDGPLPFWAGRVHPTEREGVIRSFERTLGIPGAVSHVTCRLQRDDGSWTHAELLTKNLLDEPYLHGMLVTVRDVSDRVLAIEALHGARSARDEFLSSMSQELRPGLCAILGWAQPAAGEVPDGGVAEKIMETGWHLLRFVEEALDLAAIGDAGVSLAVEGVALSQATGEAADSIRILAAARDVQILGLCGSPADARVRADRARLRQVLLHLLRSAVRHSRYAGEVVVGWERSAPGRLRILVRDTGPGIDVARLRAVLAAGDPAELEGAGVGESGLGLARARYQVELMGGVMGAESRAGSGATFWVELPEAGWCAGQDPAGSTWTGGAGRRGFREEPAPPSAEKPEPAFLPVAGRESGYR